MFSGNCWKFITNYEFSGSYYEEWICFQHGPDTLNYEHFERAQSRKRLASTSSLGIIDLNWNGSLTRLDLLRYSMVPLKHASGHDSESFFQGSFSKQSSSRPVAWHLQGRIYIIRLYRFTDMITDLFIQILFLLPGLRELFEVLCKVGKGGNHLDHFLGKLQRVMPWLEIRICLISFQLQECI